MSYDSRLLESHSSATPKKKTKTHKRLYYHQRVGIALSTQETIIVFLFTCIIIYGLTDRSCLKWVVFIKSIKFKKYIEIKKFIKLTDIKKYLEFHVKTKNVHWKNSIYGYNVNYVTSASK